MKLIGARARLLASTLGVAASLWSAVGRAAPFDLAWSAPAGCPSRDAIVAATQARLGEPRSDVPPRLFVEGTVVERRGGFNVTLAMKDASGQALGERDVPVEHRSCKEIEEPTALVLAMMIAVARPPAATSDEPEQRASASSTAAPPSPPQGRAERRSQPISPQPRPRVAGPTPRSAVHRLLLGVAATASRGALPSTGLGVAVRALYAPGSNVLVGLEASVEQSSSTVRVGPGEADFRLFGATVRLGLSVLSTTRFEVVPIVAARFALIQSMTRGFQVDHDVVRSTILAGPGVLVRARLRTSLFLEVLGEVEAILLRERFRSRVDDKLYDVHRPSAFDGRLSVGIGYEFH